MSFAKRISQPQNRIRELRESFCTNPVMMEVCEKGAGVAGEGAAKRMRGGMEEWLQEPTGGLSDLLCRALGFLSYTEVLALATVSKAWLAVVQRNSLWEYLCEHDWQGKVYIPPPAKELRLVGAARFAYEQAVLDRSRRTITSDELCEFVWTLHVRGSAPWIHILPAFAALPNSQWRFNLEGAVEAIDSTPLQRLIDEYGGLSYELRSDENMLYVNEFEPLRICRHPENWGFIMYNEWVVYTSWENASHEAEGEEGASDVASPLEKYKNTWQYVLEGAQPPAAEGHLADDSSADEMD